MEPIDFKNAVLGSPALSDAAKTWLLEHEVELGDGKQTVLEALSKYEQDLLAGTKDLIEYLEH